MEPDANERIEQAIREDGRYPPEAFEFLHRGLEYATRMVHGDEPAEGPRPVSGQQLCEGLRGLALEQWGPLAREVLAMAGERVDTPVIGDCTPPLPAAYLARAGQRQPAAA